MNYCYGNYTAYFNAMSHKKLVGEFCHAVQTT